MRPSAYLAERLPVRLVVPVVALLTIAAHAGAGASSIATDVWNAVLLTCLFAQFRLWDDLADRGVDTERHPERVLVRATSDRPFRAAAVILGALNAAWLVQMGRDLTPVAVYLALALLIACWYRVRTGRTVGGDHLLLVKYPAFVAIVAALRPVARPVALACSAASVYLAACVYEAVHDRISPASACRALVAGECLLLAATAAAAILLEVGR